MKTPHESFTVRTHVVGIEQLEKNRYAVTVDGRRFASFCSEGRARTAGRQEARRLDLVAKEAPGAQPVTRMNRPRHWSLEPTRGEALADELTIPRRSPSEAARSS